MPRDSGGAYTLPAGNPVAADTLIDAAWANSTLSDLGNEMSNTLHKDGRVSMTGPLVLTTRGTPLDTDAASWANILTRIQENFISLTGRAWRRQTKSAGYTAALTDNMSWLNFTSSATLSLPAAATAGNGYMLVARAGSGVTLTIDPDGAELINNAATASVTNLGAALLFCDGTTWAALIIQNPAATSLTSPTMSNPTDTGTTTTAGGTWSSSALTVSTGDVAIAGGTTRSVIGTCTTLDVKNTGSLILQADSDADTTGTVAIKTAGTDRLTVANTGAVNVTGALTENSTRVFSRNSMFESSAQSYNAVNTVYNFAHGLGVVPTLFMAFLRCKSADNGYAVGDVIALPYSSVSGAGSNVFANTTNVSVAVTGNINVVSKTGTGPSNLQSAGVHWEIFVRAWY